MATKVKKTKKAAAPAANADQPIATGSQADYDEFEAAAAQVPDSEVVPMRADLQLALHNVQVGVASVSAEPTRLAKLPETEVAALSSLARLVLATIFADTQITRAAPSTDVQSSMARAIALRSLLLKTAESLVEAGLLSDALIAPIRRGSGAPDSARDCIALAAVFTKNAPALRGKHPIKAAQVQEAAEVGTSLLKLLKTGRARRSAAPAVPGADMRDRLWTLVLERHDALWRAGAYLFGREEAEVKVPLLQANRGKHRKKRPAAAPATPTA